MAYSDKINQLSRQPLNVIQLQLDATITAGGVEYICDGLVPHGQMFWPCVESIEWAPTRGSKRGGLGYLGEVAITCSDFPWPGGAGTYFGRLLANNPYYLNRVLNIFVGYYAAGESFSFADMQERRYFIKKISGPDHKGRVKIEAADVLSQLKESQAPAASNGNLASALSVSATGSVNIGSNSGFSASGGYAIINDEILTYSGITGSTSITISARAQGGTKAEAHDADDPVRAVYHYSGNAVDCIRDLIQNYSEIDHANYIPDAAWNTERDDFLSSETVDIYVKEPTSLDQIIDKIGQQTYLDIWWDDSAQEIKLKAIGPTLGSGAAWNDKDNILDDKITIKRDQRDIVTQVWIYHGKIDQTKGDDPENYSKLYVNFDGDAETALRQSKIVKIFADFIPANGNATASKISSRIISQNSRPLEITLMVDAKDSGVDVGQPVDVTTDLIQGTDGLPTTTKLRVIEKIQRQANRYQYRLVYSGIEQGNRYAVIAPNSILDYDSESEVNHNKYGWIADATPAVGAADDDPYLIL